MTSMGWDMNSEEEDILAKFQNLRVWSRYGVRAPYKPMLAIWAIGRCLSAEPRLASFDTVHHELTRLIRLFGPHHRSVPTAYPFWRMQHDGLWEIDRPDIVRLDSSGNAHVSSLRELGIRGGLTEPIYKTFQDDQDLAWRAALSLLESHFPDSMHDDILQATGFNDTPFVDDDQMVELTIRRRRRDGAFRARVLDAYDGRCAVCKLSLELQEHTVGLEAAHIHWHAYGGPPEVRNGLALCVLHDKLFDLGSFTVDEDLRVLVSSYLTGHGKEIAIGQYEGGSLYVPTGLDSGHRPAPEYLDWHRRQVFNAHP